MRGFTLIELMTTLAVAGILASLAYPSYVGYLARGNRSQGQQVLLDLAQREERFRLDQGSYTSDKSLLGVDAPPATVSDYYSGPSLYVPAGGMPFFAAELTPKPGSSQVDDGRLFINSRGETWRDSDASCSLVTCSSASATASAWK